VTYLITFACYGSHLHGDESGSVDRNHNVPGHRLVPADETRALRERDLKVMADFKSYASRRLNQRGIDAPDRKRWARHGSTRWLWNRDDVGAAIRYVVEEQGQPMAVWVGEA